MTEDFVDVCVVCKKGVPRQVLVYQKGKVFHSSCFAQHGGSFPAPNHELDHLSARTRVELVLLKNLRARAETERQQARAAKPKKAKPVKKPARQKPKPKVRKKAKPNARKSKPRRQAAKRTKAKVRIRRAKPRAKPKRRSR